MPSRVEYDLGRNIYGQPVTLVRERSSAGAWSWTLRRGAGNQRDDTAFIGGLTDKQIRQIGSLGLWEVRP
jgi:hypothetical protein